MNKYALNLRRKDHMCVLSHDRQKDRIYGLMEIKKGINQVNGIITPRKSQHVNREQEKHDQLFFENL